MFLGKGVLKYAAKLQEKTHAEVRFQLKLLVFAPVNLLHILRTPFPKNTSGRLLLYKAEKNCYALSHEQWQYLFPILCLDIYPWIFNLIEQNFRVKYRFRMHCIIVTQASEV